MQSDYSLYLVTDSTDGILKGRDLVGIVKAAVEGGVTIVQYRDKVSDTAELILVAKELHKVTRAASVPLLINDRVDVAIAVGCEGVHIGQDDIDLTTARRLLGKDAIIGVTAQNVQEALEAARGGANYLGIGTVFATPTKENTKSIIGTQGVKDILFTLAKESLDVATVCIGGINTSNAQRVLYQSASPQKSLNGIAVVSAIIAANDPKGAATELKRLVSTPPPFATSRSTISDFTLPVIQSHVPAIIKRLGQTKPLCHNMTNLVVQNFAANVALCIGSSPIMSSNGNEAPDLARLGGGLVINMGTVTPEGISNYLKALKAYNAVGGPVIFDPVGAGATANRRAAVKSIMAGGYFDMIKGNESEIGAVSGTSGVQQRGVDSGASTKTLEEKARLVKDLAARERNVVLMTGKTDLISDGERTYAVSNGHEYLGNITGSGCTLGTTIAAVLAVEREDKLLAVLAGLLLYEIAAENAAKQNSVKGPGTFVPAFLDALYEIREAAQRDDDGWVKGAKVEKIAL